MLPLGVSAVKNSTLVTALLGGAAPRFQLPPLLHAPLLMRFQMKLGTLAALVGFVPALNSMALLTPSPSGSALGPMIATFVTPGQFAACHAAKVDGTLATVTARSREASPMPFVAVRRST